MYILLTYLTQICHEHCTHSDRGNKCMYTHNKCTNLTMFLLQNWSTLDSSKNSMCTKLFSLKNY